MDSETRDFLINAFAEGWSIRRIMQDALKNNISISASELIDFRTENIEAIEERRKQLSEEAIKFSSPEGIMIYIYRLLNDIDVSSIRKIEALSPLLKLSLNAWQLLQERNDINEEEKRRYEEMLNEISKKIPNIKSAIENRIIHLEIDRE